MRIRISFILIMLSAVSACLCYAESEDSLRIYLPRESVADSDVITLADVGIIRGPETLVKQIAGLSMGKFALTGQQIVIDRQTILSRLASTGFDNENITLSGADIVKIRRDERIIRSERFVQAAKEFITENNIVKDGGQIELIIKPDDLPVPDTGKDIRLKARQSRYGALGKLRIWVGLFVDGEEIAGREVVFSLAYKIKQLFASSDIKKGEMINPENIRIKEALGEEPLPAGWQPPYGLVAKRFINEGHIIENRIIGPAQPPQVITRNQNVIMRLETAGLYISAQGRALENGKVGEFIRVKNLNSSKRTVICKVNPDGTVEPIL